MKKLLVLLLVPLLLSGCFWNSEVTKKDIPNCGKLILPPVPQEEAPPFKTIKPGQGVQASNSGGVFFPKSSFSVMEFYVKSLKAWITGVETQVNDHNTCIDKQIQGFTDKTKKSWKFW